MGGALLILPWAWWSLFMFIYARRIKRLRVIDALAFGAGSGVSAVVLGALLMSGFTTGTLSPTWKELFVWLFLACWLAIPPITLSVALRRSRAGAKS